MFFKKLTERYIVQKSYNITLLRVFVYICVIAQLVLRVSHILFKLSAIEIIKALFIPLITLSFSVIFGYFMEIIIFYIVFKKYVNNSISMAEKQIAPLVFLNILIPLLFNLIGLLINIPDIKFIIMILQYLAMFLYIGYIVFGGVFKEKCVKNMVVYFAVDIAFDLLSGFIN